ncbi:MAG: asparagine synthase (glutamine-hydrolyzing), partial [Gemmataceae bacterium]
MCGIAGFWDRGCRASEEALCSTARNMADALRHRGPDAGDVWSDAAAGIALGHRRLSIIDLSEAGAQPMASSCGRFILSYNGEVYNADELRPELEARQRHFRGHSDTEVIVEGFAVWGVEETVRRLIGMFAMAVWDREERALYLIRDRLGIKPVYWAAFGGLFLFGSELKALRAHPGWHPELNQDALTAFLRFADVPAPYSIYRGVQQLRPGTILKARADGETEIRAYWSLSDVVRTARQSRVTDPEEVVDQLEAVLGDAVRRRMVADVPLGAFLSGGIDSSTVVALMQKASNRPVRTFSIGFSESDYNEAHHAAAVARHLGT